MTTADMLRYLTNKLKSQSINEVQPFQEKSDEERDSGTESDDENADLEELAGYLDDRHHDTSSYGSASPVNHPPSPLFGDIDSMKTHEITAHSLDTIPFPTDLAQHEWDFDRHSSEEELSQINKVAVAAAEKRKWSQIGGGGGFGDSSGGSSDEEVRELLLKPQPITIFSSSPPRGLHKLSQSPPTKFFLANVNHLPVSAIASRKRHRQPSTSEPFGHSQAAAVIQRPCLDFEKMQKTTVKKPCASSLGRPRIVKIRTLNGSNKAHKCLYDPAVFSFRSISAAYSPLTPVEEPSCAY